ncbi:hypothetical protein COCCADRAFT_88239 [Bipolaris zeicola 26-R-13]|uniref:Uncharacterized protein n=1 Tax=Cochliobolus carbonum (strain 26-R-13) TaxID=930089 RepID=W6YL14_COCC2|nr:uncharacterized protein COCCADRAFT_88239 [Bipolaris zeicola 26-R-13]EUC36364.1 hypothetical protein COCCADRAFT_88239 [Bipolaris zeicola 26-R-13]
MESAHLTHAHDHARAAAAATRNNSVATAGQEHDLAAAAFHNATNDTHNAEALRILALLEVHHRKLAGLIKEAPPKQKKTAAATKQPTDSSVSSLPKSSTTAVPQTPAASSTTPPTSRRRLPQSSIATNLAEKRGIPSVKRATAAPAVSNSNATAARHDQPSTPVRDLLAQHSRKGDSPTANDSLKHPAPASPSPQRSSPPPDDNFRRFYNAFGGIISAISAPLAFTSLPLNPSASTPEPEPPREQDRAARTRSRNHSPEASRTVTSSVPDLAALISKPALRALREDGAPPLGPNESFYLVPTTGGTVTYASVLRDPNAPNLSANNQYNTLDDGSGSLRGSSHEEFVDARENVGPPSPTRTRRPLSRGNPGTSVTTQLNIPAGRGSRHKTMEELALENDTLKSVIDKQAKRIQMWELSSQNSFNALAQSFRVRGSGRGNSDPSSLAAHGVHPHPSLPSPPIPGHAQQQHPPPAPTSPGSAPPPDAEALKRIADLEALLASQNAKIDDLMANNDKLAKQHERDAQVLGRYREQWEKLKAGARKKEQERRDKRVLVPDGKPTDSLATEPEASDQTAQPDGLEQQQQQQQKQSQQQEQEDDMQEEPGFGKA